MGNMNGKNTSRTKGAEKVSKHCCTLFGRIYFQKKSDNPLAVHVCGYREGCGVLEEMGCPTPKVSLPPPLRRWRHSACRPWSSTQRSRFTNSAK